MASSLFRRLLSQPQTAAAVLQACGTAPAGARPFQLVQLAALSASVSVGQWLQKPPCMGLPLGRPSPCRRCRRRLQATARDACPPSSRELATSCVQSFIHVLALQAAAAAAGKLYGACVLERLPVVVPESPAWEQEYMQWQAVRPVRCLRLLQLGSALCRIVVHILCQLTAA